MVLVVGATDAEKRSEGTRQVANKLIENPDSRDTRYSTSDICIVVLNSHLI